MDHALRLAPKGGSRVSPNPQVGACVVKHGKLIGEGFHRTFGGDHAEVEAMIKAGSKASGATLYVTLEPCSTWGKTPPCTQRILDAGISRVVFGAADPNQDHTNKSFYILKKAGVCVEGGARQEEAERLIAPFAKWITTGLPYVTLKMAQSLDGKIACANGRSRWISGPEARRFVHDLRQAADAVMVGKKTALVDNPQLRAELSRKAADSSKPWRIVVDPEMKMKAESRVFKGRQLTLLAVSEKKQGRVMSGNKFQCPQNILFVPERKSRLDFRHLLKQLGRLGVVKLLVEGGGETSWSLLREGLVDRVCWIVAPKFIGGRSAVTSVEGDGFLDPNKALNLKDVQCRSLGMDWLFEGSF